MRKFFSRFFDPLRRRAHPDVEELAALATGVAEAPVLARLHLDQCPRCRDQVQLMREQWRRLVQASAQADSFRGRQAVLEEILALVQAWDSEAAPAAGGRDARRPILHRAVARRLAAELEVQLGRLATDLTQPARSAEAPVHAMLARSGHVLSTFLGYRAAVRLSQAALRLTGSLSKR